MEIRRFARTMKPKLLITLGCSLTEGVGCYNLDLLPKNPNQDYFLDLKLEKHSKRFLKYGWPNVLGNHLNYDLVINMGTAGIGPGGNIKDFISKWNSGERKIKKRLINLSDYEVLLYWWIPSPNRYSFYFEGEIETEHIGQSDSKLSKELLNKIGDYKVDMILETQFYLNVLKLFCEKHDIKLIWTTTEKYVEDSLDKENFSGIKHNELEDFHFNNENLYEKYHSFCKHPNEDGYELIAFRILQNLINKHNIRPSENFKVPELYYDGLSKHYLNIKVL